LRRRWQQDQASVAPPGTPFAEAVAAWLDATLDHHDWARLLVWQALGDCPFAEAGDEERYDQAQRSRIAEAEEKMRQRQLAGEVTGKVTPQFALLVCYAVVLAPVTMPQFVRDILGGDPVSPAVRQQLHSELVTLLGRTGD
jgi:TetR/AcrR family transcriptional regulator